MKKIVHCRICNQNFNDGFELELHFNSDHPEEDLQNNQKLHQCEYCDLNCKRADTLKSHVALVHSGKMKKIQCNYCERFFTRSSNLKKHIATLHANSEFDWECNICGVKFQSKNTLKSHNHHVHESKKNLCTICENWYTDLKYHIFKTHSNRKLSKECDFCGKTLLNSHNLKNHILNV